MLGMLLVGGGLIGTVLLGLGTLPGGQGLATVAEVPGGVADAVAEVELLLVFEPVVDEVVLDGVVDEVVLDGVVPVVVVVVVLLGVVADVVGLPVLVPLLAGVHGATVVWIPDWFWVLPIVPPVTEPALPATPGVPGVTEGWPVALAPGGGVVLVVPVGEVLLVPVGFVVVPGWDVVVLGVVVCGPIPGLGVTVPVFWAVAVPIARANTDDANKIFRIEACSLSDCSGSALKPRLLDVLVKSRFVSGMRFPRHGDGRGKVPVRVNFCRSKELLSCLGPDGQMRCFASILRRVPYNKINS